METKKPTNEEQNTFLNTLGIPPIASMGPEDLAKPEIPRWKVNLLGLALLGVFVLLVYALFAFWPSVSNQGDKNTWNSQTEFLWWTFQLEAEIRILLLVMITGSLGSLIHAGSSFSNFVGENKIENSWTWWYILRPFVGLSLALVFYFVFRAGLVANTPIVELNIYGILTLSTLVGLFSDRATFKLEEVFESLFHPKTSRKDDTETIKEDKEAQG